MKANTTIIRAAIALEKMVDAIHTFNQLDLLPLAFSRAKDAKLCKTCAEKFSGKKQNSEQELASHHHQQRHQASGVLYKNIRSRHHQMLSVATFFMVYHDMGVKALSEAPYPILFWMQW